MQHAGDKAGDTSGGEDSVLALFLGPGNTHASRRFTDVLAALEELLGPLERLPGLVLDERRALAELGTDHVIVDVPDLHELGQVQVLGELARLAERLVPRGRIAVSP